MTADTVGGIWSYALELAGALASRGVTTALAAMGGPPTRAGREAALAIPGLDLFECSYRLEWMDDPWDDLSRAGAWLLDLEARVQPDVIHLNGYCHGALPWRAPAVMVAHSCVLSWWRAVLGEPAPARFDRYRAEVAQGLRAAAVVVAPTATMLNCLTAHYGALVGAAPGEGSRACEHVGPIGEGEGETPSLANTFPVGRVIPNGRDRRRFRPGPKECFVFAAGRLWDAAKNLAALAAAAPRISWPILLAGSDSLPGVEHTQGGICRRDVHVLGWMEQADLARWMSRAAIYAMPARYEPFGLSILEAGLSGCALVLGDIPSLREVWRDAAVFIPPDDPEALARAVQRLIDDAALRAVLGARARRRAVRFTPLTMARGYLAAYRDALAVRAGLAPAPCLPAEPPLPLASPLPAPSLAALPATREEPCA